MAVFEVTIGKNPPCLVSARSASAARYSRYLDVSDLWSCSFADFLKITKVRKVRFPQAPRHPAMTDAGRELARHALGLPNARFRSYRNGFVTSGGSDEPIWRALVAAGLAGARDGATLPFGGHHLFWLTAEGARSALDPGETLCPEDFPAREAA